MAWARPAKGRNISHQQKKLNEKELREFRARFTRADSATRRLRHAVLSAAGGKSGDQYLLERRKRWGISAAAAGGGAAQGAVAAAFKRVPQGLGAIGGVEHDGVCAVAQPLLRDKQIGRHIVPIIPDEARTFGMDALFREIGIYAPRAAL
jgi:pyruvate dehydrogenase E1 component